MSIDENALVEKIQSAFADVPMPVNNFLDQAFSDDMEVTRFYSKGMGRFLGRPWTEIAPSLLAEAQHDLSVNLTPNAYHYYLPAVLITIIKHEDVANGLDAYVIRFLTRSTFSDGYFRDKHDQLVALCNKPQAEAILDFARYYSERLGHYLGSDQMTDEEALVEYWADVVAAKTAHR